MTSQSKHKLASSLFDIGWEFNVFKSGLLLHQLALELSLPPAIPSQQEKSATQSAEKPRKIFMAAYLFVLRAKFADTIFLLSISAFMSNNSKRM